MLVALCGSYAWQKDGTPPQHCHRCQDLKKCPLRHCACPRQKCLQAGRQHAALDTRLNGEQSSSQHPTILQGGHTTARPVSGVQDTRTQRSFANTSGAHLKDWAPPQDSGHRTPSRPNVRLQVSRNSTETPRNLDQQHPVRVRKLL